MKKDKIALHQNEFVVGKLGKGMGYHKANLNEIYNYKKTLIKDKEKKGS